MENFDGEWSCSGGPCIECPYITRDGYCSLDGEYKRDTEMWEKHIELKGGKDD